MKPFDRELAKQGHPVCTESELPARIICFDAKGSQTDGEIIALITLDAGYERIHTYTKNGKCMMHYAGEIIGQYDLFMAPTKKKGWINIYLNNNGGTIGYVSHGIYSSKKVADEVKDLMIVKPIDTIEIEWEE